ncbi:MULTISPECIES: endonuclease NucS domain-containing protein [Haloferax]|uniref:DUF91 domain-containing protein n=1 Tax=Haloferax marinum TaxID=2666143 RepID=A0A6A8G5S4_9EURY|nr:MULTISPECIES: endonuclease NucS domain-containing protein [Haloferax]KAB1196904.1 DUF91 domain-containing protein [Haloferax sp. CBA1150]MRW95922.1 DUF91 domain-containing protein [Haloferax marinum]
MLFRITGESSVEPVPAQKLAGLGILERQDLQEWVVEEPQILGEELLIVTSEYAGFENTLDRLDVLALDRDGKLVVVELKRDRADATTDLQALKYASFCSNLTAEDVQQLYQEFHSKNEATLSPEEVGNRFANFVDTDERIPVDETGWATFELDNRPRVVLAAGDFGTEITSPVLWLNQEYGLDISCVRLQAYEHDGGYLVQGQRIIPVPEAEEYMTKRRKKQDTQSTNRRPPTFNLLFERGVLREGDELLFNEAMFGEDWAPAGADERWDPEADLWRAVVTGKPGLSNNVSWCYDDEEYSFTGLTRAILLEISGGDDPYFSNAFWYWTHPEFDYQNLSDLRDAQVTASDRKSEHTN